MIGWRFRLNLTGWILGAITLFFLAYQWLPIFTLVQVSCGTRGRRTSNTTPRSGTSSWRRSSFSFPSIAWEVSPSCGDGGVKGS